MDAEAPTRNAGSIVCGYRIRIKDSRTRSAQPFLVWSLRNVTSPSMMPTKMLDMLAIYQSQEAQDVGDADQIGVVGEDAT